MKEQSLPTLGEFIIEKQMDFKYSSGEFSRLISCIQIASKMVNRFINKAGITNVLGEAGNRNVQGEEQQKLDVIANEIFINALSQREVVCGVASEENDDFIEIRRAMSGLRTPVKIRLPFTIATSSWSSSSPTI